MKHFIIAGALCLASHALAEGENKASVENSSEEKTEESAKDQEEVKGESEKVTTSAPKSSNGLDQKQNTCINGQGSQQMVRKVWITYGNDQGHDCEVHYAKETEDPGNKQVLWKAQQNPEYCQEKAQFMVDKLKNWGWTCSEKS
ncbi:MAG: hypothetical protein ACOH5I_21745 [Oligoflexus sp.]